MGSRKENIKKLLGISDYPWSSDDDEDTGTFPPPAVPEPTPTVRPSQYDAPGTSGAGTSSSNPTPFRHPTSQSRMDRETFWTLLNNPRRVPTLNLSKSSTHVDVPLALISRPTTSRSASQCERTSQPNPSRGDVIQRLVAIGRFSRNAGCRPSKSVNVEQRESRGPNVSVYPGQHVHYRGNVDTRPMPRELNPFGRGRERTRERDQPPASPHLNEAEQSFEEVEEPSDVTGDARPSADEPVNVDQSDDEEVETDPAAASPSAAVTEDGIQQNEDSSGPADGSANNLAVTLEEIVEIDTEPEAEHVTNEANNDDQPHRDPHQDPMDAGDTNNVSENRGTKRKHESSEENNTNNNNEPASVKEFNQSLLRLLECPVCLEWMEPPMSQCRRGHLVCSRCRARLAFCPVCRTAFSSVRNRAMEGVADMLRYPCRHGCGREVRLRQRAPHEASCSSRRYRCVLPACADRPPLPHEQLALHFQRNHMSIVKMGRKHKFTLKVNAELHENWVIMALREMFHLRIDVDVRTWGVVVYASYIGPKCYANSYSYEVSVMGKYHSRKLVYTRATHCDLECSSLNVSRRDCFHLTLDQALNFLRVKNRHCEPDDFLHFTIEINKCENPDRDDSDS